jgi:hypothetical protein
MKKFIIILSLFISYSSFAQKTWEAYGFYVYTDTKDSITLFGLKNADGKIVVSPNYTVIMTPLKGGYAYLANVQDKKLTDNEIIELGKKEKLKIFMGLIDSTGKVAIEPTQYESVAYYPNDNLVSVSKGGKAGVYSLLTKRIEVPIEFDKIDLYHKNLPLITVEKLKKFGIYNIELHKLVVPCLYDRAPYTQYDNRENKDKKVIGYIVDYSDPIRSGYLDALGNVLIELKYFQIAPEYFGNDYMLGVLRYKPDNADNYTCRYFFHYFNTNTIKISDQEYTEIIVDTYTSPNALVNINGKWGLFNCLTEQYILEPQFEKADHNYGESFVAYKNNKAALYDFSGNEMNFDVIKKCTTKDYQEYYSVCKNKKWGCLDYKLNYIIPLEYDKEVILSEQMWVVKNGKWGCIDKKLLTSVSFIYDTLIFSDFKIVTPGRFYSCMVKGAKIEFDGDGNNYITKDNGNGVTIKTLKDALINADMPSVEYHLVASDKTERNIALSFIICSYNSYDINYKFYAEAFKKLINTNIDFNYTDDFLGTFLHKLAYFAKKTPLQCSWEIEELVKKGIDPNQKMKFNNNRTALLEYLFQNDNIHYEIVQTFLKVGSKVAITDSEGNDALDLAKKAPKEVKEILKEYKNKEK